MIAEEDRRSRHLASGALAVAAFTLCCMAFLCALPLALRGSGSGYEITACIGLVTTGRTQVGIWWQAIFMSRLLPATLSPYAACTNLPWSESLPSIGEIAFPP
jgi:hypothetical protein